MPYHAVWYEPYRVIDARVQGRMTMEDWEEHRRSSVEMLTEARTHAPDTIVHLLFDALKCESMPPVYLTVPTGLRVLKHKNRGLFFLITQSDAIRSVMEVTAHVTGEHYLLRVFNERQAALDALAIVLAKETRR